MGGGSVGLQAGGQKTDYVLLIMNEKGLKGLLEDKFEVGGEASAAAGPVGRTTSASTNVTMDAEILTYSRSKGLFAGVALKGVVISQDHSMNQAVYQKPVGRSSAIRRCRQPMRRRHFRSWVTLWRNTCRNDRLSKQILDAVRFRAASLFLPHRRSDGILDHNDRPHRSVRTNACRRPR